MEGILFEITIFICLASVISIIFRLLKQPAILAYILTGIIIGPFGQLQLHNQEELKTLSQLGITLLLFMMGLELKLKELRSIGKTALSVGGLQILLTSIIGFLGGRLFGFSPLTAFYIGVCIAFSSTVIVVKLLSDKKDLTSLYGKISVGLLLVQDFFAIIILIVLSALNPESEGFSAVAFAPVLVKAVLLFGVVIYVSQQIFPRIIDSIAKSSETLFLFSLAWVFGFAGFIASPLIGFPIEIGGFLAGLSLANTNENFQIVARIKALRDFFITLFFIMLGVGLTFGYARTLIVPAVLLSFFVLIGKPLVVITIMGIFGYKKRTSFLTGINLAQISEFSLIILFFGNKLGHVSEELVALLTLVGIITFTVSTYLIIKAETLYGLCGRYLTIFEGKTTHEEKHGTHGNELALLKNHIALIGVHRMGQSLLYALKHEGEEVLTVDFDPDIVKQLKMKGVMSVFGDIADMDIQQRAGLDRARLIISTVPNVEDNLLLLRSAKHFNTKTKIIVMAQDIEEAKTLYKSGASYVVLPHIVGGRHLAKLIKEDKLDSLESLKTKDLGYQI